MAEAAKDLDLVCMGNKDAMQFLTNITEVLHFWDDLIDRDVALTDGEINQRMWTAMVDLQRNPFYLANFGVLSMALMTAIVNWEVANTLERDPRDETDLQIAFILRSSYADLVTVVALLVGGRQHAVACMLEARRVWHDEGFAGYKEALEQERILREKRDGM